MIGPYLVSPAASSVATGGRSVQVFPGSVGGGYITNPLSALDQGITPVGVPTLDPEPLYVSLTGPASLVAGGGTTQIAPGETFAVPNTTLPVWVNAASDGHRFSAFASVSVSYPPTPYTGAYPPAGPVTRLDTIPSYLYQQYQDDDDLQYFVMTYNGMTQSYVDWFNNLNLPIYTKLSGYLLDWVGSGLYGLPRPTLFSYKSRRFGPFNTYALNGGALNAAHAVGASDVTVTSDDVYKRIITWHFYKGDGRAFNTRWLKRRVRRFLYGVDGTNNVAGSDTTQISVNVGVDGALQITIVTGLRVSTKQGSLFNAFQVDGRAFNVVTTSVTNYTVPPMAATFKEAMESGALEMPAQYQTTVTIGTI